MLESIEENSNFTYNDKTQMFQDIHEFFSELSQFNFCTITDPSPEDKIFAQIAKDILITSFQSYSEIQSEMYILINSGRKPFHIDKQFIFNQYEEQESLTLNDLRVIAKSDVAVEMYYIASRSQNLFGLSKETEPSKEQKENVFNHIKTAIDKIIDDYQFYKMDLRTPNRNAAGVTIINNIILLNTDFYRSKTDSNKLCSNAKILCTILHEIAHVLFRTKGKNENNYFCSTIEYETTINDINGYDKGLKRDIKQIDEPSKLLPELCPENEMKKKNQVFIESESGKMIDLLSTENIWNYNLALSEFLLNQNNWFNKTIEQFRQQCLKFVDADDNLNNKSDNTKSRSTFNKMFFICNKVLVEYFKRQFIKKPLPTTLQVHNK